MVGEGWREGGAAALACVMTRTRMKMIMMHGKAWGEVVRLASSNRLIIRDPGGRERRSTFMISVLIEHEPITL